MTRPRSDVVIRRFLDGDRLSDLVRWLRLDYSMSRRDALVFVEDCIRRTFERAKKARGKKR